MTDNLNTVIWNMRAMADPKRGDIDSRVTFPEQVGTDFTHIKRWLEELYKFRTGVILTKENDADNDPTGSLPVGTCVYIVTPSSEVFTVAVKDRKYEGDFKWNYTSTILGTTIVVTFTQDDIGFTVFRSYTEAKNRIQWQRKHY